MPKEKEVKSVLNKSKKRDAWFLDDYTFNPYSSCSFNCLFCYIRGSKYGTNLEQSITVKINAIEVLEKQLSNRAKKGDYGVIVLASATDPYIKIDRDYQLTRKALEVILKYRFPVHILTRSNGILRDLDLLHEIDKQAILPADLKGKLTGVMVSFSFSSLRDEVARIFEPGATRPSLRLETMEKVKADGFKVGVSLMPLIPFISDTTEELKYAFSTFSQLGVDYVMPATITLFGNGKADGKTLMLNAIRKHYPHLEKKYISYFANGHEMPLYYRQAFSKKMIELKEKYKIPDRILQIN